MRGLQRLAWWARWLLVGHPVEWASLAVRACLLQVGRDTVVAVGLIAWRGAMEFVAHRMGLPPATWGVESVDCCCLVVDEREGTRAGGWRETVAASVALLPLMPAFFPR